MKYNKYGITMEVEPIDLSLSEIQEYAQSQPPKIIFRDNRFRKLSYNEIEYDEHQIRRIFRGQTYITFKVRQMFMEDGRTSLRKVPDDCMYNNVLVKVSKRDVRLSSPTLKLASKDVIREKAEEMFERFLSKYESILNGNTFRVKVKDETNNVSKEIPLFITNEDFFSTDIKTATKGLFQSNDDRFKDFLCELFKQEEFRSIFNRFKFKTEF